MPRQISLAKPVLMAASLDSLSFESADFEHLLEIKPVGSFNLPVKCNLCQMVCATSHNNRETEDWSLSEDLLRKWLLDLKIEINANSTVCVGK